MFGIDITVVKEKKSLSLYIYIFIYIYIYNVCICTHAHTIHVRTHVHTHTHTMCTGRFPVLMLCLYRWGFSAQYCGGEKKRMSVVSTKWESIWGWNAFVQPLIKKVQTFPLSCLILCRLLLDWGAGLYCCCILAHMFLNACDLTAEKKKSSLNAFWFSTLSGAAFARCLFLCVRQEVMICNFVVYIYNPVPVHLEIILPLRSSSGWYWLQ